ncbi:hypothetical protein MG296_10650 [Flavobacteriaceae bacterium TK19130]|nr:hypothetical protein [Thermobacterium salinum]
MYTLRRFSRGDEDVQSNCFLGSSYELINRETNPKAFRKAFEKCFNEKHVADLDESSTSYMKACQGFVYDGKGNYHYLNKTDVYYIVSSDGKTFDNLTYRS